MEILSMNSYRKTDNMSIVRNYFSFSVRNLRQIKEVSFFVDNEWKYFPDKHRIQFVNTNNGIVIKIDEIPGHRFDIAMSSLHNSSGDWTLWYDSDNIDEVIKYMGSIISHANN